MTGKQAGLTFSVLILSLVMSMVPAGADECAEIITIDSVEYSVPARWCGNKLDSTQIADPETLVRLAEELTYEDYRIYVLTDVKAAFSRMAEAAKQDSIDLIVDSGYRSASFQERIIRQRLEDGQNMQEVLTMVAPPGYSEHETGRAVDLVPSEALFASSKIYLWLTENASRFGFRESYPESTADSISWEPWHWYYGPAAE